MKYRIGEFSRITMMSIKTLRYYHEINLLVPSEIDEESGYRYYDESNYQTSKVIILLKAFDFSIKEIQEIMANYEDDSDIRAYLLEKNESIQAKIDHYKDLQNRIEAFKTLKEERTMPKQIVNKVTVQSQLVASLTYTGKYQDVGIHLSKLFKSVGMNINGKPISIYHDEDYREENATVEVCIPLKKEVNYKGIETKRLQGGEAFELLHIGPYDRLHESYKQLMDYLLEHDLKLSSPLREQYIKGPGMLLKGNPEKYKTLITAIVKTS